uniref:Uncharacterized protein n=1 Tax=Oryza punctata TaxID=4537 RepID=A0A0E0MFA3_ORYPU
MVAGVTTGTDELAAVQEWEVLHLRRPQTSPSAHRLPSTCDPVRRCRGTPPVSCERDLVPPPRRPCAEKPSTSSSSPVHLRHQDPGADEPRVTWCVADSRRIPRCPTPRDSR